MILLICFLGGATVGHLGGFALRFYLESSYLQKAGRLWLLGGTGFIFSTSFLHFGSLREGLIYGFLGFFLLFISIVDSMKYIIPDKVLLCIIFLYSLKEDFHYNFSDLINFYTLLGIAFFLKIGYLLGKQKEGLGWGDVKFFSLCGLWIKLELIPVFLCLTGIFGVCLACLWRYRGWGKIFPLGPALCFALWIVVLGFSKK